MHTRLLSTLVLVGTAATLAAQITGSTTRQTQNVVAYATRSTACPVAVMAKYIPDARIVLVGPAAKGDARQPLQLSFGMKAEGDEKPVAQATVTVRGISEKGGVIPAEAKSSPWLVQTFTVNVGTNAAGVQSGTVWLNGYGGVSEVRIDSIRYANGAVWKPDANESCHASTGSVMTSSK